MDSKTHAVVQTAQLSELTFVTVDGSSHKTIAYIINSGLGVRNCHGLKAKSPKEAKAITTAIGTAIVTAANDTGGKLRMASAESRALARNISVAAVADGDASAPLGLFQATYLATVGVGISHWRGAPPPPPPQRTLTNWLCQPDRLRAQASGPRLMICGCLCSRSCELSQEDSVLSPSYIILI